MNKINVIVKKDFIDRYTGLKHKAGENLTVTDARFREMKRSGDYVEVLKAEAKEAYGKK